LIEKHNALCAKFDAPASVVATNHATTLSVALLGER
jgi:hypothetical protein